MSTPGWVIGLTVSIALGVGVAELEARSKRPWPRYLGPALIISICALWGIVASAVLP